MDQDQKKAREIVARGVSAWEREDFDAALATFEGVLAEHPYFADVQNKAGLCLTMLGRLDEALGHFDAALAANPAYAEAHLNRGIMLNEMGRHEEAQESFVRAGEIDTRDSKSFPSDVGNRIAVTHAQLGDLYLMAGHPHDARAHYETALGIRPRFMDIRGKYAEALIELGDLDRARAEFEEILDARPGFVAARVRLGAVLLRQDDTAGAIEAWERAVADDPDDMRARAYLASVGVTFPRVQED